MRTVMEVHDCGGSPRRKDHAVAVLILVLLLIGCIGAHEDVNHLLPAALECFLQLVRAGEHHLARSGDAHLDGDEHRVRIGPRLHHSRFRLRTAFTQQKQQREMMDEKEG